MQSIAISQVYNEELFVSKSLSWIYPLVDKIVISEGRLTPHGNLPQHSSDNTRDVIQTWIYNNDAQNKVVLVDAFEGSPNNRESAEANNKNYLLSKSGIENGDMLFILDADEFPEPEGFIFIQNKFKDDDTIRHVPLGWYNFVYNLRQGFKYSIDGRFFRWTTGCKFKSTNHLINSNQEDLSKDYKFFVPFEQSKWLHLSYAKHPKLIREKIIGFARQSLIDWYNYCYLIGAINIEKAYANNTALSAPHGWKGGGFCEGLDVKLEPFTGELPASIRDLAFIDYTDFIKTNINSLVIR